MRILITAPLLLSLLTSFTLANTPAGLTPGGYRPKSNIHAIPAGGNLAHVGDRIYVLDDGSVVHVVPRASKCWTKLLVACFQDGYTAFANWVNTVSTPVSSLRTTWTVPSEPETFHGQTVFLWPGMQPATTATVLQPVLQSLWSILEWRNIGHDFFTPLINTIVGATLNGLATLTGTNGTSFDYTAQFRDIPGTTLNITLTQPLASASEALESYGVAEITDYPAGSTTFSNIQFGLADGTAANVTWLHFDNDEANGIFSTIDRDGTNSQITITF
ncbi:hypothetical protein B0H19DRAFT_1258434 [Mycena capillaripes]|nr:hypothetical protein B0H19DRAFT_1258434 [Mycena capillaripes]